MKTKILGILVVTLLIAMVAPNIIGNTVEQEIRMKETTGIYEGYDEKIYCTDFEDLDDIYENWSAIDGDGGPQIDTWTLKDSGYTHYFHCTAFDFYLANQLDYLILNMGGSGLDINGYNEVELCFDHWCEGESMKDYGYVEISFDGFATPGTQISSDYYQTVDWEEVCLTFDTGGEDALFIRWVWQSDPSINYRGWYIDNVCVYGTAAGEDTIPPTTTKTVGEPQYDDGYYVTSETPFTLTAEDNPGGSGVSWIYYRIDGGSWMTYSGPFTISGDGEYYIDYYAVDNAQNEEEIHQDSHCVDNDHPDTLINWISDPFYLDENQEAGQHWKIKRGGQFRLFIPRPRRLRAATITVTKENNEKKINKQVGPGGTLNDDGTIYCPPGTVVRVVNDLGEPITKKVYYNGRRISRRVIQPGAFVDQVVGRDLPCPRQGKPAKYKIRDPENVIIEEHMYPMVGDDGINFYVEQPSAYGEYHYSGVNNEDPCDSGVKTTEYRTWYNGEWSDWYDLQDEIVFNNLGLHYLEYYSIDNLGNVEEINTETIFVEEEMHAPSKPTTPVGQTSGKVNKEYSYTTSSTDLDDDQIYYLFRWGDETETDWLGPYPSGDTCTTSHTWTGDGSYDITVIARDENYCFSEWSDPLSVSMPKNKPYINTPFLSFLENHPNMFPLLRQLLGL